MDSASSRQFRILCIGDSITHGRSGDPGGSERPPTYSYRYPLFKTLIDHEVPHEFVGHNQGGFEGSPQYPPYRGRRFTNCHSAHWGWTTWAVAEEVCPRLEELTPDFALVMLGSNDSVDENLSRTLQAQERLCHALREANPWVAILIGLPFQDWAPFPWLAKCLVEFAQNAYREESPVVPVEPPKGWICDPDLPGSCTVDWVHPNERGDEMLALNWFGSMRPYLAKKPR